MMLLLALGCAAPDVSEVQHDASVEVVEGDEALDAAFIAEVDAARASLALALPAPPSDALAEALTEALSRGVALSVVTDVDVDGPAFQALAEAGAELRLADGALTYFDFALNTDVSWTSEQVVMSHSLLLVDGARALVSSGYGGAGGARLLWRLRGEDLLIDLGWEHNQLMGGLDAASLTAFSSLAKSVVDWRWAYPTSSDLMLELWLGPQERLVKRVIDATYSARASVWILTDDLADEGLVTALQAKAADGFDVQVVVGAGFGQASPALSRLLETRAPSVARHVSDQPLPTLVLIDQRRDRLGRWNTARALAISHPLRSAARIYLGQEVPTDQLIDGNLLALTDGGAPSPPFEPLLALFEATRDAAEPMP